MLPAVARISVHPICCVCNGAGFTVEPICTTTETFDENDTLEIVFDPEDDVDEADEDNNSVTVLF